LKSRRTTDIFVTSFGGAISWTAIGVRCNGTLDWANEAAGNMTMMDRLSAARSVILFVSLFFSRFKCWRIEGVARTAVPRI
jgi:hypothetical protein